MRITTSRRTIVLIASYDKQAHLLKRSLILWLLKLCNTPLPICYGDPDDLEAASRPCSWLIDSWTLSVIDDIFKIKGFYVH